MQTLSLFSPAKTNLFLRVHAKRSDGYHNLTSLFQALTLCDKISISTAKEDLFTCTSDQVPHDSSNLVMRALKLWREKTGITERVAIHLEKQIPVEAGLGGGSSNAATTLWGLSTLFKYSVDTPTLIEWGACLGSDIPFFFSHGTALCQGRGEIVNDLIPLVQEKFWIVKPSYGHSSAQVFAHFNPNDNVIEEGNQMVDQYIEGTLEPFNDLEDAALKLNPKMKGLQEQLISQRAKHVVMSGSGTSWICQMNQRPQVSHHQVYPVQFLNRIPGRWYYLNHS